MKDRNPLLRKLGVGTVQFGLDYGVANKGGRTLENEACRILSTALAAGCSTVDTASAYGESEIVVGQALRGLGDVDVITKIRPLNDHLGGHEIRRRVFHEISESLQRLQRESIDGVLVHRADDLLSENGDDIYSALCQVRDEGLSKKIGISVYDVEQLDAVRKRYSIDVVQLPLNVIDQRFLRSGQLSALASGGIEIHVRSIFLQGLLLLPSSEIPSYFSPIAGILAAWHERVAMSGRSANELAYSFAANLAEVDRIIVGFDNAAQLESLLGSDTRPIPFKTDDLACDDLDFVNPARWRLL